MTKTRKDAPHWPDIEPHWRAGIKTKIELADQFKVSRAAMNNHFANLGIERDLLPKIQARAKAILDKEARKVTDEVTGEVTLCKVTQARLDLSEPAIVEVGAAAHVGAVRRHSAGIARAWRTIDMLMAELEVQTGDIDMMHELGELLHAPDEKGMDKLNEIYRKAVSLPSRSSTVKTLLDALKTAIGLEREALGITDRTPGSDDDPISAIARVIRAVQGTGLRPVAIIDGESEVVVE